jgi:hypothetical protein
VVQAMRGLSNAIDGIVSDGSLLICDRDQKWITAVPFESFGRRMRSDSFARSKRSVSTV